MFLINITWIFDKFSEDKVIQEALNTFIYISKYILVERFNTLTQNYCRQKQLKICHILVAVLLLCVWGSITEE